MHCACCDSSSFLNWLVTLGTKKGLVLVILWLKKNKFGMKIWIRDSQHEKQKCLGAAQNWKVAIS